ncbi:Serine carboxypeptidase-like 35 [Apostasia shenzhenica]|uniref:Carboxypeptidase n=1 Tax=Apostasia shenzhenica TaxID=1088818 RepID=A0A2I0AHK8_9ASPA|nr:Serine carboxypeptidase-like 35 [Apostasia shenzhenica]
MASSIISHLLRSLVLLLAAALARSRSVETVQGEADRVTALPGQPPVKFRHYAGYVGVGSGKEKALFYWFFEAERRPDEKPLVLWLNGERKRRAGPGCSSVAYGEAQELGPFLVRSNGPNLTLNPFAWNKVANILFLEAPVGVGFSYTNRTSDLRELGDRITAKDSYSFLLSWFRRFPQFRSHDFYLAGESYAGHYVPQLAVEIYEGNRAERKKSFINLKGFMIGNAVINDATDQMGMVEYAWSHAIISDELHSAIRKHCGTFQEDGDRAAGPGCSPVLRAFLRAYSDIDIYSIYTPVCGYDPCTEDYVEKYFNREDVQIALHANVTRLSYQYSSCSEVIEKWNDSPATVLPILHKLMNAGLRIWVYSGDTDGRVPVTSTRYSIKEMRLKAKGGWRAWYYEEQVAGWFVEYEEGLTLATVRGAGHQVPVFAPDRSLALLSHFLHGRTLPTGRFSRS